MRLRARVAPQGRPALPARRTPQTGADLLTDKQKDHLADLFDAESHGDPGISQTMIAAYCEPDRKLGKELMDKVIDSLSASRLLVTLGRTLKKRADDVLA